MTPPSGLEALKSPKGANDIPLPPPTDPELHRLVSGGSADDELMGKGRGTVYNRLLVLNIFYVHPYLGKVSNLTQFFQMSWNHQPDKGPAIWGLFHKPWNKDAVIKEPV